jgi:aminoglycoside/choline kinase family phosphotransferase
MAGNRHKPSLMLHIWRCFERTNYLMWRAAYDRNPGRQNSCRVDGMWRITDQDGKPISTGARPQLIKAFRKAGKGRRLAVLRAALSDSNQGR